MDSCDVLIVGGGPAGSTCAAALRRAGLDVVVMDRAPFPRDKVCAGWITPQVVADAAIDVDDYRRGRTLQAITGFRTGAIGLDQEVESAYGRVVSYGIRRCEFDEYLLRRSGARLMLGAPVTTIGRDKDRFIVNGSVTAAMIVGAGGHFCPVARWLNGDAAGASPLVVAQEAEFPVEPRDVAFSGIAPQTPELYFCRDLGGYGWCFRKGRYLNIGLGRFDRRSLKSALAGFVAFLRDRSKIPRDACFRWRGHAYLVSRPPRRSMVEPGVLLVGDAAGLAYPESGEGIRPAIESGLLAASAIVEAGGRYTRDRLLSYERAVAERFGFGRRRRWRSRLVPPSLASMLLPSLLGSRWFVRHLVLDRWFLHAKVPALVGS